MIDIVALRTLVALDALGSVTATADSLGYTPAAVSHQLQKLSRYLGAPVTERTGRGISLTPMGRELSSRGAQILHDLEGIESEARARSGDPRGRITVGGFSTGIRGLLVPALPRLRAAAPELTVTNVESDPDELVEMVSAGRIDAALIFDWNSSVLRLPSTLTSEVIAVDRADIVMHRDHHLADRAEVTRSISSARSSSPPHGARCAIAGSSPCSRISPRSRASSTGRSSTTRRSSSAGRWVRSRSCPGSGVRTCLPTSQPCRSTTRRSRGRSTSCGGGR